MRIAYLILCHTDAAHVMRLARRLTQDNEGDCIFIHVDLKSDIFDDIAEELAALDRVFLATDRVAVYWGSFSSVNATYALLDMATSHGPFDRYVILQGADYPIKSNRFIHDFFMKHPETEFLRAVDCPNSDDRYLYSRCRYSMILDRPTVLTRIRNKIVYKADIKTKPAKAAVDGAEWNIYWGCAQFAITHACATLFMTYRNHSQLSAHFQDLFAPDETYFHTILYNCAFSARTAKGGAEPADGISNLTDLTNLTYFEYPKAVKIFELADYDQLRNLPHLYARKMTTDRSGSLLDRIDEDTTG